MFAERLRVHDVRLKATEGTSAQFLLESGAVVDRIHAETKDTGFELGASYVPYIGLVLAAAPAGGVSGVSG